MIIKIAGLGVEIDGNHEIVKLLSDDYKHFDKDSKVFMKFEFKSGFPKLCDKSHIDMREEYWNKGMRKFLGTRQTLIKINEETKKVNIFCSAMLEKMRFFNNAYKFYNSSYLSRFGLMAIDVTYDIIEPLFNYFAIDKGFSLIHASGLKLVDGNTIIFCGEGGVGKTSSLLSTCYYNECLVFGDDYIGINKDGIIYPYPKKMIVYANNLEGFENSYKFLESLFDKLDWNIKKKLIKKSELRRRPHLTSMGLRIADSISRIDKVYYLSRGTNFSINNIKPDDLAHKIVGSTVNEHSKIYNKIKNNLSKNVKDIKDKFFKTVVSFLSNANCKYVVIPFNATPIDCYDLIIKKNLNSV